jgi:hypothetical protein
MRSEQAETNSSGVKIGLTNNSRTKRYVREWSRLECVPVSNWCQSARLRYSGHSARRTFRLYRTFVVPQWSPNDNLAHHCKLSTRVSRARQVTRLTSKTHAMSPFFWSNENWQTLDWSLLRPEHFQRAAVTSYIFWKPKKQRTKVMNLVFRIRVSNY